MSDTREIDSEMRGSPSSTYEQDDDLSVLRVLNILLQRWRLLVVLPSLGFILFAAVNYTQPRSYTASASFMPHSAVDGRSRVSGVAAQLGIDVGGSSQAGQSPDFYAALLLSREVLRAAVETEYTLATPDGPVAGNLLTLYGLDPAGGLQAREAASRILAGAISVSPQRTTGLVRVSVTAPSPVLAEQIAARLLDLMHDFNHRLRQSQAAAEGQFIEERLSEVGADLRSSEDELKVFLRQNRQFRNSPELIFEYERLERQVELHQSLYNSLAQSLERARMDQARNTPLITVLERPEGSARANSRGTISRGLLGMVLGLLIAAAVAFTSEYLRRTRYTEPEEYRKLETLRRQVAKDLGRPFRRRSRSSPPREAGGAQEEAGQRTSRENGGRTHIVG